MPRSLTNTPAFLQALEDVEAQESATEINPDEAVVLTLYYRAKLALKEREVTGATLH